MTDATSSTAAGSRSPSSRRARSSTTSSAAPASSSAELSDAEALVLARAILCLEGATGENGRQDSFEAEIAFIESLWIEDKVSGELIPFELWEFQRDCLRRLREGDRLLLLKARQLGVTWLILAHLLYLALFWGNRLLLIFSQSGEDAVDALHRVRIMYGSLAEPPARLARDNTKELVFANGSRIKSMKATRRSGRSQAPYAVLADELAFWTWPEEQMASLDAAQRIFAPTTGNGPGDLANRMWDQAQRGQGRWKAVFYPWDAHPGRDREWYRQNVLEAPEPRLARREYASEPSEAFAAPGGRFFERWSERNRTVLRAQPGLVTRRAVDFGFRHPAALWIQRLPSGQPVVVRELVPAFRDASAAMTTPELAARMLEIDAELGVSPLGTFCDPAGKAAGAQTGESEFEVLQRAGLVPEGKPSGIRDGCVALLGLIADPDLPLLVSDDCPCLIEALTSVPPDKSRPDLYDQRESSPYQHVLDALRYWAINEALGVTEWYVATNMTGRRPV